ncbi:K(+) efflux antiporter 5 [Acorus calamus]|uniref:K(+) efflux antiporter 5 n=1 Tax=Acorus calamus TaxID=4465 RepID=A0AAV9E6G1_ACOCL|nr:K(+) efflux antiporter 5 [Acorus calamus]
MGGTRSFQIQDVFNVEGDGTDDTTTVIDTEVIVGYLLAGSIIGPGGLNFISEMVQVEMVVQFGVGFSPIFFRLGVFFDKGFKFLVERNDNNALHGQVTIGILILQHGHFPEGPVPVSDTDTDTAWTWHEHMSDTTPAVSDFILSWTRLRHGPGHGLASFSPKVKKNKKRKAQK